MTESGSDSFGERECVCVPTDNLLVDGISWTSPVHFLLLLQICASVAAAMARAQHSAADLQDRRRLHSPLSGRRNRELVSSLRGGRKTRRLLRKTERVKKRMRNEEVEDNKLSLGSAPVNGAALLG